MERSEVHKSGLYDEGERFREGRDVVFKVTKQSVVFEDLGAAYDGAKDPLCLGIPYAFAKRRGNNPMGKDLPTVLCQRYITDRTP